MKNVQFCLEFSFIRWTVYHVYRILIFNSISSSEYNFKKGSQRNPLKLLLILRASSSESSEVALNDRISISFAYTTISIISTSVCKLTRETNIIISLYHFAQDNFIDVKYFFSLLTNFLSLLISGMFH